MVFHPLVAALHKQNEKGREGDADKRQDTPDYPVREIAQTDHPETVRPWRDLADRERFGELPIRGPSARDKIGMEAGDVAKSPRGKERGFQKEPEVQKKAHRAGSSALGSLFARSAPATALARPPISKIQTTGPWK